MTKYTMSRRVRVLSVAKSTGGIAGFNSLLCSHLNRELFDLHVICLSDNNRAYATHLRKMGIAASTLEMERYKIHITSDLRLAWQLLHHICQEQYNVIIGFGTKAGFLIRLVGRLTGKPAIYGMVSMALVSRSSGRKAGLYRQLERVAGSWGGYIASNSYSAINELVQRRIVLAERTRVIHPGVDLSFFEGPLARKEACKAVGGVDPERPTVGWAARYVAGKAPLNFIRAAMLVTKAIPSVQICMAGEGPLEHELRYEIERLGLKSHIVLLPWQSDMRAMYSACDVYASSSMHEGLPQSILEAMAMQCVPVATAVDGTTEAIRHGVDGYLVPPEDHVLMAKYIITLLNNEPLRQKMGLVARQRIESHFTIERWITGWEELILQVAVDGASTSRS